MLAHFAFSDQIARSRGERRSTLVRWGSIGSRPPSMTGSSAQRGRKSINALNHIIHNILERMVHLSNRPEDESVVLWILRPPVVGKGGPALRRAGSGYTRAWRIRRGGYLTVLLCNPGWCLPGALTGRNVQGSHRTVRSDEKRDLANASGTMGFRLPSAFPSVRCEGRRTDRTQEVGRSNLLGSTIFIKESVRSDRLV